LTVGIAEDCGLIGEIGQWVLRRSCEERARWLADRPGATLDLAVNVSPRQIMGHEFQSSLVQILEETATAPNSLTLEVTENIFIGDNDRVISVLSDLLLLGIHLALDDFGTGYSSLSYLRRLPIDILKIDQSFTANIGNNSDSDTIMPAIVGLAHAMDLVVIAEGVETQGQDHLVAEMGCDFAQGYLYGKPMSGAAILELLSQQPVDH